MLSFLILSPALYYPCTLARQRASVFCTVSLSPLLLACIRLCHLSLSIKSNVLHLCPMHTLTLAELLCCTLLPFIANSMHALSWVFQLTGYGEPLQLCPQPSPQYPAKISEADIFRCCNWCYSGALLIYISCGSYDEFGSWYNCLKRLPSVYSLGFVSSYYVGPNVQMSVWDLDPKWRRVKRGTSACGTELFFCICPISYNSVYHRNMRHKWLYLLASQSHATASMGIIFHGGRGQLPN